MAYFTTYGDIASEIITVRCEFKLMRMYNGLNAIFKLSKPYQKQTIKRLKGISSVSKSWDLTYYRLQTLSKQN